jgi:hypothetical protein
LIKLPGAILETLAAIVAPFFPSPPAVTNTQMLRTGTPSTTEETTNETDEELNAESNEDQNEDKTQTNEQLNAGTNGELAETPQELTTETTEEPTVPGTIVDENTKPIVDDNTKPLMNVLRNSLTALPGGFSVDPGNGSTTTPAPTPGPESVEPEQNSQLGAGTDPTLTDPATISTGVDGGATDTKPGGKDDDNSSDHGQAAAA